MVTPFDGNSRFPAPHRLAARRVGNRWVPSMKRAAIVATLAAAALPARAWAQPSVAAPALPEIRFAINTDTTTSMPGNVLRNTFTDEILANVVESLVALKGDSAAEELDAEQKTLRKLGLVSARVVTYGADLLSVPTTTLKATIGVRPAPAE